MPQPVHVNTPISTLFDLEASSKPLTDKEGTNPSYPPIEEVSPLEANSGLIGHSAEIGFLILRTYHYRGLGVVTPSGNRIVDEGWRWRIGAHVSGRFNTEKEAAQNALQALPAMLAQCQEDLNQLIERRT